MDQTLVDELKADHSDIFYIAIDGVDYFYRPLLISEIKRAQRFTDDAAAEDYFVTQALLHPKVDIDDMLAGDVMTLAEAIMSASGILDAETVKSFLEASREALEADVVTTMKAYIIAAMPSYTDESLDCYSIKELIDKVVMAEQILTLQQGVMGLQTEGVRVQIVTAEDLEEMAKKARPTKEQLLTKLKKTEEETVNRNAAKKVDERLDKFSEDDLARMTGKPDPNDPFLAKLLGKG